MRPHLSRRAFVVALGAASLAGCTGGAGTDPADSAPAGTPTSGPSTAPPPTATAPPPSSAASLTSGQLGVSGAPPMAETARPLTYDVSFLRDKVVSGGPPKDGIPSIDEPSFEGADAADARIADEDVVFGVVRGDEVKTYPQKILVWHEIVNDEIDGVPVSVTYCPLTGTAMGFARGTTEFGVSGKLVNNNLVMYDRETDSRWPQVLGTAIEGPHQGSTLQEFRVVWTSWARWKRAYPETRVLTEDTGHARNYDRDPYGSYTPLGGYYEGGSTLFPALAEDDRYPAKAVVVGARTPAGAAAFPKDALRGRGVVPGDVDGVPHVAVYGPALDTGYVYRNPDGLELSAEGGTVTMPDGSTHHPAALPLEPVVAIDSMWFAWSGFYPETGVHE